MNVKVSIPVSLGGYTGQRDAWEQHSHNYEVEYSADNRVVTLVSPGSIQSKIVFDLNELEAAIKFINAQASWRQ